MDSITVKAFGKVLVFGGYAILEEGYVGMVVNVDKGTSVHITPKEDGISIELPQYSLKASGSFEDGKLVLEQGDLRLEYLINAITLAKQFLQSQHIVWKPFHLVSENDAELLREDGKKTGLGSSASATVAIVAAVLAYHGIKERDTVYKISCYSHHLSQERIGSNYDVFASCYGSHFFTGTKQKLDEKFMQCMASQWNIERKKASWPEELLPVIIFTGKSASTKAMVEKVLVWKKKDNNQYTQFMEAYDAINQEVKKAFLRKDETAILKLLEQSWAKRKELGILSGAKIETDDQTVLLDKLRKNGAAAAGLVGAGGGDSILAICKDEAAKAKIQVFAKKQGLSVLENAHFTDAGYITLT